MINNKPNIVFGDGALPSSTSRVRGKRQAIGMRQPSQMKAGFASYLTSEGKILPLHDPSNAPANKQNIDVAQSSHSVPFGSSQAISPQLLAARQQLSKGITRSSNLPRRYSFGMVNPLDKRKEIAMKAPKEQTAPTSMKSGTFSKVMQQTKTSTKTTEPLRHNALQSTLKQASKDIFTPISAQASTIGGKSFDYALMNGRATKNLLEIFRELGKASTVPVLGNTIAAATSPAGISALALLTSSAEKTLSTSKTALAELEKNIGNLSAKFESGEKGIAAIGYDRYGGTSYGKYQMSSRSGTVQDFIKFLKSKAPDIANQLLTAGSANTGSKSGKMPRVWQQIASKDPVRFEQLQKDFIMKSHFKPTIEAISEATGINISGLPSTLQEVIFSTAVQHGSTGATKIISKAINAVGDTNFISKSEEAIKKIGRSFIRQIYDIRSSQFASSSGHVQYSVKQRLRQEMQDALAMLEENSYRVS